MDGSQITGASSSYARKYALNGLFAIDDTKDSDATNTHGKTPTMSNDDKRKKAIDLIIKDLQEKEDDKLEEVLQELGKNHLGECSEEELKIIYNKKKEWRKNENNKNK